MHNPVDHRRRELVVPQDRPPFAELDVGDRQHRVQQMGDGHGGRQLCRLRRNQDAEFVDKNLTKHKKATLSFDGQITSQSPEFATWHSLLPAQLPESRCILCRRLRISMDSGEFSRTRSMRLWSSTRSQLRRWAFFLMSRENAAENSAVNLPISASPLRQDPHRYRNDPLCRKRGRHRPRESPQGSRHSVLRGRR